VVQVVVARVSRVQQEARLLLAVTVAARVLCRQGEVAVAVDAAQTALLAHQAVMAVAEPHTLFLAHQLPTQVAVVAVLNLPLAAQAAQVVVALQVAQQQATAVLVRLT